MGTKQSSMPAANKATAMTTSSTTHHAAALLPPVRRVLQNFLLIWLDANFNEADVDFKNSLQYLRKIVASITTFTDVQECIEFLNTIKQEKVFMIVSGSLSRQVVRNIESLPQLESIYVFCGNKSLHEEWARKIPKIKGVYTDIEPIYKALLIDRENCDRATISITFNGIDALFMYTQLLKETVLEIEDDDKKSIKELVDYCRLQDDISEEQINKLEGEYRRHTPIWWYTAPYFMYSMLNRGLRIMDADIIIKMAFFIRHLHKHIEKSYREQQAKSKITTPFRVFRGQGLSHDIFEKMKKTKGELMSFNNFLSTSRNRQVSLDRFARPAAMKSTHSNDVGILFVMTIDPKICETSVVPYVTIGDEGFFKATEEEILFSTHTIFRIDQIQRIKDEHTDRLWEVHLTLTGNENSEMNALTEHVRSELNWATGWARLGSILINIGESAKAEHLFHMLLEKPSLSDRERANYHDQIGTVYKNMGEYSKALSSYERSLEIRKVTLPPTHPHLATSYNNIGSVYDSMGEYSKALSSYERSLDIRKVALPPNHPGLATSYNNIGLVYKNMGEYSKALSYYEKDLEITQKALPANHPSLATSYNNIGSVYDSMGEYSKALSSYERSLEIWKVALPPNHPDLATSYNNIGSVYDSMGEYSKALSSYERSLEIRKVALPPNHPDLATSYNNIGSVYRNMGEYSKALSYLQKAADICEQVLPPTHPNRISTENSIEQVKKKL